MMVSGHEANNQARLFLNNSSMLAGSESDFTSLPEGEDCTFSGEWNDADNDLHQCFTVEADAIDGTLTLGVRSNGFFKADDFQLTYLGPITSVETINNSQFTMKNDGAVYDLQGRCVGTLPLSGGAGGGFPRAFLFQETANGGLNRKL